MTGTKRRKAPGTRVGTPKDWRGLSRSAQGTIAKVERDAADQREAMKKRARQTWLDKVKASRQEEQDLIAEVVRKSRERFEWRPRVDP